MRYDFLNILRICLFFVSWRNKSSLSSHLKNISDLYEFSLKQFGPRMSEEIRNAYKKITSSYLAKKQQAWKDLLFHLPQLHDQSSNTTTILGVGNGRNVKQLTRTLVIALDISEPLLRSYIGHNSHQRVLGALPGLPFRSMFSKEIYAIAVIHHIKKERIRLLALREIHRICQIKGQVIITVWRKWRSENKNHIIKAVKNHQTIQQYIDDDRPWKNPRGETITTRFYHYYTWKELYTSLNDIGFTLKNRKIMGGKYNDANFLIELEK